MKKRGSTLIMRLRMMLASSMEKRSMNLPYMIALHGREREI